MKCSKVKVHGLTPHTAPFPFPTHLAYPFHDLGNHRIVWDGRDLKDHLLPTPLAQTGTLSTRPGCSKPHLAWT